MIAQYVLWGCGATTVTHTARYLRRATHGGCVGNRARAGAWKASAVMTAWSVRRAYLERGARLFATGAQHAGGMVFAQRRGHAYVTLGIRVQGVKRCTYARHHISGTNVKPGAMLQSRVVDGEGARLRGLANVKRGGRERHAIFAKWK